MRKQDFLFGILLTALLISYFFIMKGANLYENFNLRFVNVLFFFGVTWLAIRNFYEVNPDRKFNYLTGLLAGFRPAIVGVVLFSVFQMIYLSGDATLMAAIQEKAPMGESLNPFTASLYLLFEGIGVGLIVSYLTMRIVDARQIDAYEERLWPVSPRNFWHLKLI